MLVHINYTLTFDAPFHFGTGVTAGGIDRTVIRSANNFLYVPASTFKGVLREHCEQLHRYYLPNVRIASPHNAYAALAQFGNPLTFINRIFGSQIYPGSLRFDDARLQEAPRDDYQEMLTSIATQVRIDRLTRTSVDNALYTSEFGMRTLAFNGTIKGTLNCTPIEKFAEQGPVTPTYSLLLLLAGILLVERLGGNKSTGKGQCRTEITLVELGEEEIYEEQWHSWIEGLNVLSEYQEGRT